MQCCQPTDLFAVVILVPVLAVVDVVQVPARREQRTESALRHVVNVVAIATPHLNDRIWFHLHKVVSHHNELASLVFGNISN